MQSLSAEPETETSRGVAEAGRKAKEKPEGKACGSCEKATQIKALHNEAAAARSATKSA